MACPTCDHTMQSLGTVEERTHYWCPRCGTHRSTRDGFTTDEAPRLVHRCHNLRAALRLDLLNIEDAWHRLGIAEAISTPNMRS